MDPESIAEIVAAIVGFIKGMVETSATKKWQEDVSGKLDGIIAQNAQILAYLKQLPLLFEVDLEKFFNTEVAIQGKALCMAFDNYMKGHHPDTAKIKEMTGPSERLLTNLIQRSPCIYQAANAVALLVLAIHKMTHADKKETQGFVDQTLKAMINWAGTNPGMFGRAIIDTQTELTADINALSAEPRGHVEIYSEYIKYDRPGPGTGHPHPHTTASREISDPMGLYHLVITADIVIDQNNFTSSVQNARSSHGPDGLRFTDEVVQTKAAERAARLHAETSKAKSATERLDVLQKHERALQKMIAALQHWQ